MLFCISFPLFGHIDTTALQWKLIFCCSFISVSFLRVYNWDTIALVFVLLFNLFGSFVFRIFIYWNIPILNVIGTAKRRKASTEKEDRMIWLKFIFVPHRSLLYNNKVFPVLENRNYSILIAFSPIRELERKQFGFKKYGFTEKNIGNKLIWNFECFGKRIKKAHTWG